MTERVNRDARSGRGFLEHPECSGKSSHNARNRDGFKKFPLKDCRSTPVFNSPCLEMSELGGKKAMSNLITACVEKDLAGRLPSDLPMPAVCAKSATPQPVERQLLTDFVNFGPGGHHDLSGA